MNLNKSLCLNFSDPVKALDYIVQKYPLSKIKSRYISSPALAEEVEVDSFSVKLDIRSIFQEIYNPHRFKHVPVVVVDYAMPRMDGIKFCQALKKYPLKCIMLTGQADESVAVQAFNEGLIDKFILKTSDNLIEQLTEAIQELQINHFNDDNSIFDYFTASKHPLWFQTKMGKLLFKQIVMKHHIVEYYLIDDHGSFLMLDADASPYWVIVNDDEGLQTYIDIATELKAPDNIMNTLCSKEQQLFFFTDHEFQLLPTDWDKHLYEVNTFIEQKSYYYSIIKGESLNKIDLTKVLSFNKFMEQNTINASLTDIPA